jgi:hypothetical protein
MIGSQCKREESETLMSAESNATHSAPRGPSQLAYSSHVSRPLEVL